MGLEPEGPPDPADGALAHAGGRHRAGRPVRRVGGLLFERLDDHPFHVVVGDGPGACRAAARRAARPGGARRTGSATCSPQPGRGAAPRAHRPRPDQGTPGRHRRLRRPRTWGATIAPRGRRGRPLTGYPALRGRCRAGCSTWSPRAPGARPDRGRHMRARSPPRRGCCRAAGSSRRS